MYTERECSEHDVHHLRCRDIRPPYASPVSLLDSAVETECQSYATTLEDKSSRQREASADAAQSCWTRDDCTRRIGSADCETSCQTKFTVRGAMLLPYRCPVLPRSRHLTD